MMVISEGRMVMYFNRCRRTRRSRLFLGVSVFRFGIFAILAHVFDKRGQTRPNFIAHFNQALDLVSRIPYLASYIHKQLVFGTLNIYI